MKFIQNFFDFSPSEARGFIILSGIIVLSFATLLLYNKFDAPPLMSTSEDREWVDSVAKALASTDKPNAQNFQTKYNNSDEILESRIATNSEKPSFQIEQKTKASTPIIIDINTADTAQFKQIRGIGSAYSSRIIKFRQALGGFVSLDQLSEVYGLEEFNFNQPNIILKIDTANITQLNINRASYDELKNHPYFAPHQASQLIKYRSKVDTFTLPSDILKLYSIDSNNYFRLKPYIKVKN